MASGSNSQTRTPPTHKKDFQMFEDVAIAKAWTNIGGDAVVGANQPRVKFWLRIWEIFVEICPGHHNRNQDTICARWNNIVKVRVNGYVGCQRKAYKAMSSGKNHQIVIQNVGRMYHEQYGHAFSFDPVLEVLQELPKYNYLIEEDLGSSSPVDDNIFSGGSETSPMDGPAPIRLPNARKKKARERKRKGAMQSVETRWESVTSGSEGMREEFLSSRTYIQSYGEDIKGRADAMIVKRIEIEQANREREDKMQTERMKYETERALRAKLEAEKMAIEDQIMFKDESNMTEHQLNYLRTRQHEIAQRRGLKDPRFYD